MRIKIKTQTLVLGAGPGGYSAAFRCADLGMDTTIVERYPDLGGVCLNVGCIPSKTLLYIAKLIETKKKFNKYGILSGETHIDLDKARSWKDKIIDQLSNSLSTMAKNRNVKVIDGVGKFIDSHTIQVENNEMTLEIAFNYAIIAAGSHTVSLPCIPNDQRIWNSTDALSLQSIPERLLIIGSGAIGLEMATIYHAFGSKIDIVEMCNRIMPILDEDITNIFTKIINKNINLILNTKINIVEAKKDGIYVTMENKQTLLKNTQRYDALLVAIGRAPNGNMLNIERAGVNVNEYGFIPVDKQMRTNVQHIFAIGDIIGYPMLAHKSIHEGHVAAEVISGKKRCFDPIIIPSIIYTDPEIAWVGYTEKDAQEKNIDYEVALFPWMASGRAITEDCKEGITKLIFNKKTNRIIGGSILGTNASEILGEIALAIEMGCDVEDITLTIHAHPTLYESIGLAASIHNGSITDLPNIKKQIQ
ncbi:dihydrolipoyl dehydrogenase [Blochmannia endosymbiont of Camponotus modoc]|uniref:dihydrolipoyl dehydrogenase n=1 Tax=Blochmannia endosymbiont of Camponotus modoc TaxID=2945587 RepID=UPI0020242776|nr:dihydrolipoyl dehydrogenase [Blochmannia endosymbiont of Camponotus modoc]URJ29287.1 dihydrolipoyl dehydrogenase [Blochmannia endosymbiont of Camponotus modoc]